LAKNGSFAFAEGLACALGAKANVPEYAVGFRFLFFFMQQKFLCHSVVGFCLFTMNVSTKANVV